MTPYLQDTDFTLYNGDALEVLRTLPAESVHMCVTSPPFYGLRDYGMDGQIGLEETPEQWVAALVEVFREVRRVLRRDGSLWLEVGDSYAAGSAGRNDAGREGVDGFHGGGAVAEFVQARKPPKGTKPKDLIGAPWMLAFALRADGWYLRSDIVWSRPNPMPESVTDRPTKSHSYVFLLAKSPRYFWDQEAVREGRTATHKHWLNTSARPGVDTNGGNQANGGYEPGDVTGRNIRSVWKIEEDSGAACQTDGCEREDQNGPRRAAPDVWDIATQPYAEAHFATFPEELVRRCILAGTSERGCCPGCGAPWVREVERVVPFDPGRGEGAKHREGVGLSARAESAAKRQLGGNYQKQLDENPPQTIGWHSSCECGEEEGPIGQVGTVAHEAVPCTVLDPFGGSGTTALVARKHNRRSILIELNEAYCQLTATRTQQLSVMA